MGQRTQFLGGNTVLKGVPAGIKQAGTGTLVGV